MNRDQFFRLILIGLFGLHICSVPVVAEDAPANSVPSIPIEIPINDETDEKGLAGPAEAALGRVFGVEGRGGDIAYYSLDFYSHTPKNAAIRSLAVPGWGQLFNEQKPKGFLMMGTVFVTGLTALIRYQDSRKSYDDYKAAGVQGGAKYDDYEKEQGQALALGTIAVVVWGLSIWDAHRNAYNALWSSRKTNFQLAVKSDGAEVTWEKRF